MVSTYHVPFQRLALYSHEKSIIIDNTVVDLTQSGYPASGEINHCNPRAREYTNIRQSL